MKPTMNKCEIILKIQNGKGKRFRTVRIFPYQVKEFEINESLETNRFDLHVSGQLHKKFLQIDTLFGSRRLK